MGHLDQLLGTLPPVDLEPEQRAMPLKLKGMPLAKGTGYARGLPGYATYFF